MDGRMKHLEDAGWVPVDEEAQEVDLTAEAPQIEPEEAYVSKYTVRRLGQQDILPLIKILRQIGFRQFASVLTSPDLQETFISVFGESGEADPTIAGIVMVSEIVGVIVDNYESCEDSLRVFCASVTGLTVPEIEELPLEDFIEIILLIVKSDSFKAVFTVARNCFVR